MPAVRIGVATRSLRRRVRTALDLASRIGAEGVEIDLRTELPASELTPSALREIRKLLDDLRLKVPVASFPTRRGFGDEEQLDRRLAATHMAIQATAQLGGSVLVLQTGPLEEEEGTAGGALLLDSLITLAGHGDHFGVQLALETPSNGIQLLPGLLKQLPQPTVAACLNPAELLAAGQSPSEAASALGDCVGHLYASDAVRDLSARGAVSVELGRGSVDWPELLSLLEEHNYRGWASLALRDGGDPAELENAVAYLRAL